jgi:hypothetical protein
MDTLSHDLLEQFLQGNMKSGDYTLHDVYICYLEIMNRGKLVLLFQMEKKSLEKRLIEICNREGSWLVRKGTGQNAKYHKWVCHKSHMTRKQLIMSVRRVAERVKLCLKW